MKFCQLYSAEIYIIYYCNIYYIIYYSPLIKTLPFRAKVIYSEQTAEEIFIFRAHIV